MRKIYIVAPTADINDMAVVQGANFNGCSEIVVGLPPRLAEQFPNPTYPLVYTEPDDPEAAPVAQAVAQLRNTFRTTRTAAQINNSIDALTILVRQIYQQIKN